MITIKKKLLAVVLSVVVGVTFIPLLGSSVYAETETGDPADVVIDANAGAEDDADIPTDGEEVEGEDVVGEDSQAGDEAPEITDANNAAEDVDESADDTDASDVPNLKELLSELPDPSDSEPKDLGNLRSIEDSPLSPDGVRTFAASDPVKMTVKMSGNTAIVKGSIAPEYQNIAIFGRLFVDGVLASDAVKEISAFSFSQNIKMSTYDIGYHTVYCEVFVWDAEAQALNPDPYYIWKTKVPSKITAKPNYSGKFYYVYSKYFEFYPFDFGKNQAGEKLYMEYKIKGAKKWKRSGYMQANAIKLYAEQCYTIKKLKPNKIYKTRLRYGRYVTYSKDIGGDGKSYFFGGPVRNTKTIKTGKSKKPAFKSVTVKAVKVKKHKVKHPAYWYYIGGAAFYHKAWTEKYYTYKLKVTVKLKKKPGTKGLWINGKFVKGNKKKYTVTLPGSSYSAKKPKGKKFKVGICSYQGKSFGGLSPLYHKKKKIK